MSINRKELVDKIKRKRALFTVGTGVSRAATNDNPHANWKGLIESGLLYCAENDEGFKKVWLERKKESLRLAFDVNDVSEIISIASSVEDRLKEKGQFWGRWLKNTIGELRVCASHELVEVLHKLGQGRLATCNYDDVLTSDEYSPFAWNQVDDVIGVLKGDVSGVVHLHGHWRQADSVVLGVRSYLKVLGDERAQNIQRAMVGLESLVFVGFGGGLSDPNIGGLLSWFGDVYKDREDPHFVLVTEQEKAEVQKQFGSLNVVVLSYGQKHEDLAPYLKEIASDAGLFF